MTMRTGILLALAACRLVAQPVIAPSNEPLGSVRGDNAGGYNIVNSFETGYRLRGVGGNLGKYRSDVNFGNGLRLLGSNLTINSREGHGGYFDEILLNTIGLGNDPYQLSTLRIQKNRIYRYDMLWRQSEYYNPGLTIANGQHFINTTRGLQDHSIVLLPQSAFKLLAGYSRNAQNGPALSTIQLFDSRGDEFPLFANVRRLQNEFRLGTEVSLFGYKLLIMRSWEGFRDDTEQRLTDSSDGNNSADQTALSSFRRTEPSHGSTNSWRANLLSNASRLYNVNGCFAYASGRRDFIFDESAIGTDRFGAAGNRQTLLFGNARRPITSANLMLSLFPTEKLTVTNQTAFHNTRMEGDGNFREISTTFLGPSLVHFQFLGIRTVSNATDANYRVTGRIGVFAGYQYSTRNIRSTEQVAFAGIADPLTAEQDNTLHAGRVGVRLRPVKPLSLIFDAEVGRADRPFFTTSERNYQVLGGRIQYKTRSLTLTALARTNYNTNSVSLANHGSRSRNYTGDISWTPFSWFGLDASYSKIHLDTLSAIAYFYQGSLVDNDRSFYVSNIHSGSFGGRFGIGKRADIFLGYSRIQDTGGNSRPLGNPISIGFVQYPLTFESPFARLSVKLQSKIRWNLGYQYYRYGEDILPIQNYRAHTGFTSLSWSF